MSRTPKSKKDSLLRPKAGALSVLSTCPTSDSYFKTANTYTNPSKNREGNRVKKAKLRVFQTVRVCRLLGSKTAIDRGLSMRNMF
jgi:hypothetical protein